jgi:hypothetical protein
VAVGTPVEQDTVIVYDRAGDSNVTWAVDAGPLATWPAS